MVPTNASSELEQAVSQAAANGGNFESASFLSILFAVNSISHRHVSSSAYCCLPDHRSEPNCDSIIRVVDLRGNSKRDLRHIL